MKAQPKHLSCIAVASFHLACLQHQKLQQEQVCKNQNLKDSYKISQRLIKEASKFLQIVSRSITNNPICLKQFTHFNINRIIWMFKLNFKTLVIFNLQYIIQNQCFIIAMFRILFGTFFGQFENLPVLPDFNQPWYFSQDKLWII
jgi:hypothetical protein